MPVAAARPRLRAPFPWFGGKSRVAHMVWDRFGPVRNYVEPFAGSLAVLLARPGKPGIETVNDKDAYVSNFWRAVQPQGDPDAVAYWADWPVNEADLHARHRWLVTTGAERLERLLTDPEYFDPKVAGWWVWGLCAWIGSGWCTNPEWRGRVDASMRGALGIARKRPALTGHGNGVGVNAVGLTRKLPLLGGGSKGVHAKRPVVSGTNAGKGVHRTTLHGQLPCLRGSSGGAAGQGIHASGFEDRTGGLVEYMRTLSDRLRHVRVCVGDFERVLGPAVTTCIGVTGVFLDPPYDPKERSRFLYAQESDENPEVPISQRAREWALANAANPKLRIALCGYEGEHDMPADWECVAWKARGGYGRSERGRANARRERIWFSPACLRPSDPPALELEL